MIKKGSTLFLKGVLVAMALGVLALCVFVVPAIRDGVSKAFPFITYVNYFLVIAYVTAVVFFVAIYQAFKLLINIDKNKAFSLESVKALKNIMYCGIIICILYTTCMPLAFQVADADDAPGLIIIWLVITCAPIVVSVFAAILERLVQNAIDIKSENELTV